MAPSLSVRKALTLAGFSLFSSVFCHDAEASVVYSSLLTPLPDYIGSFPYQSGQTGEIGDHIALGAGNRALQSVTVTMESFAAASSFPSYAALNPNGFEQAFTLNLYSYAGTTAGALIGTESTAALVPFKPVSDPTCPLFSGVAGYRDNHGMCQNGIAFEVTFNFSGLGVTLPDDFVFGVAFSTRDYGVAPVHAGGPYDSLNIGIASGLPTIGTDLNPKELFFRRADGFVSEIESFRTVIPAQFVTSDVIPEPSSMAQVGLSFTAMVFARRQKRHIVSE